MVRTVEADSQARAARLEQALAALRERFGERVVYRLRENQPLPNAPSLSTGSLGLDLASGIGGVPRGRIAEIHGPPTSGKGTLASHVLADAQRRGGFAALIDASHAADFGQLQRCGVDLEDLLLVAPQSAREALDIACLLAASHGLDALVVSAVNGLVLQPYGDPAAFAAGLRRLVVELADSPTAVVFLVDVSPAWRSGGGNSARALAYAASLRIACTPLGLVIHASGEVLGLRLRAEVVKNKLAPPNRSAEIAILRDRGVHVAAELLDLGIANGLVQNGPGGLGYQLGDRWLGRGREPAVRALDADASLLSALREALLLHQPQTPHTSPHS